MKTERTHGTELADEYPSVDLSPLLITFISPGELLFGFFFFHASVEHTTMNVRRLSLEHVGAGRFGMYTDRCFYIQ